MVRRVPASRGLFPRLVEVCLAEIRQYSLSQLERRRVRVGVWAIVPRAFPFLEEVTVGVPSEDPPRVSRLLQFAARERWRAAASAARRRSCIHPGSAAARWWRLSASTVCPRFPA
eukprot:11766686-Heterocapsa_arctica.AAC.1